jgi:hypothetical protein
MESSTHAEAIHESPAEDSVRAGHEVRDVNIRALLGLGAAIASVIVVVLVVLSLVMKGLEASATRSDPELSPLAGEAATAAPRLQATPVHDYLEYRRHQEETLHSYAWIDRNGKVVRVPISRAMELTLERGLPEPAEQPKSEGEAKKETSDQETDR